MPATILVTGAAGFAGSHLLDRLVGDDAAVVAWYRPGGKPPATPPSVRCEAVDLPDVRDTVRAYQLILERGVPGRPYNVCSGRAVTIRHLLDLLIARARCPVTVKIDPARYRPNDN